MSDKKLFLVDVSSTMMVLAETQEDAEAVAEEFQYDDAAPQEFAAREVTHAGLVPPDWLDSYPWHDTEGDEPERTVQQILDEGAA